MPANLERQVQRYGWDRAAARYEESWHRPLQAAQTRLLARADLERRERVLDVACGTGLVTFGAAQAVGPGGAVVGIDLSEEMIALARARGRDLGHVRFQRMDAEDLLFSSASFDVAICALGLMYVPDAAQAVREMTRVVLPGGRVLALVWGERSRCGWAEVFPIVEAQTRAAACPSFFALGTANCLSTVFEESGLIDVNTQRLNTRLAWTSPDEACTAAFAGGPVALACSRFDDTTRETVQHAYLQSIAPWRTSSGAYAVPGEFVIVSGRKARY